MSGVTASDNTHLWFEKLFFLCTRGAPETDENMLLLEVRQEAAVQRGLGRAPPKPDLSD